MAGPAAGRYWRNVNIRFWFRTGKILTKTSVMALLYSKITDGSSDCGMTEARSVAPEEITRSATSGDAIEDKLAKRRFGR